MLSVNCTSQKILGYDHSTENDRNHKFMQKRSNDTKGRYIYKGPGLLIYKSK